MNNNTYQTVISGLTLVPPQLMVDSPYIYVVGENYLLYQYDFSTYTLFDSLTILQNTRAAIHKNYLFTWSFTNPLSRVDKNALQNNVSLTASINGFFRSFAFSGDTAYLLSSDLGNKKMRLHTIEINTMQIMHIDIAIGTGREASVYKHDSLLYCVYMNESNNDYEVKTYGVSQQSVSAPTVFMSGRSIAGFFGRFSYGKGLLYAIDNPATNRNLQRIAFPGMGVNNNFVSRTSSVFDALKLNTFSSEIFVAETNGDIKRYDTSGSAVGSIVNFTNYTTTYDIAFHRQVPSSATSIFPINNRDKTPIVNVYANYKSGMLNVDFFPSYASSLTIKIYNVTGQLIMIKSFLDSFSIKLPVGVYVYSVGADDVIFQRGKVVVAGE